MSVYTSFEMVRDCRANRPDGWIWFVTQFANPCLTLLEHYGGGEESLRRFLIASKDWMQQQEPATNRELMTQWRARLLEAAGYPRKPVGDALDLEFVSEALAELTALERQMVWFETMSYGAGEAARILHVGEEAVDRARNKAAEMLRAKMDDWTRTLLRDCGPLLGEQARSAKPEEPVPFRSYLEIVDGRLGWQQRMEVERQMLASWYEVDHLCRIREADDMVGRAKELSATEAKPYLDLLGIVPPKPSLWKRVLASR